MGTFLGDFFRFGIWISLHTEEGFLRGNGLLVFCFSILSFLEGETVSFFLGGGWWGGGTTCFAFRGLRFWRAKLCPFCAGGGGGTMCFVFIVFRGLGVWTGKLYPFFAGGGGRGGGDGWGNYVLFFRFKCLKRKLCHFFCGEGLGVGGGAMCLVSAV